MGLSNVVWHKLNQISHRCIVDLEDLLFEWENALIDGINSDEEQKPSKIISNGIEIISKGIFEKE